MKKKKRCKEILESEVKEKEIIVKEVNNKEIHEEEEEEEQMENKEKIEINEREKEKSVEKLWHATTLVPSSKLVCMIKCWDSSNHIDLSNISRLCHEGNKVNEEEFPQPVETNYKSWKDHFVCESQCIKGQTYLLNQNENLSKVKVICDGFFRFIFDPGGIQATNSRSNSLEEGGNDVILKFYPLTRRIISVME
ncbi:unnamed protein product [Trifolium pratense]|uniref:Uncharacterized protein n=1 Tax=Trifolium pratense TaxID=57577 RepID=A0ACB0KN42_TRIPR|nr:unnamed protein product [Trifolium pratense]